MAKVLVTVAVAVLVVVRAEGVVVVLVLVLPVLGAVAGAAPGVLVVARARGARAVDLVRLVADDDDGDAVEVAGLVDLVEEVGDVLEGVRVEQVVDEDVGVGVAKAVRC